MTENLWPEFHPTIRSQTVRRLLLEAGEGLAERTDNRVRFVVVSRPLDPPLHECFLYAPDLGYRYLFLRVFENGDPYPVSLITANEGESTLIAKTERALLKHLRDIFHSELTTKQITSLLENVS